ncbi:MAG: hypothetical protein ACOYYS_02010 [Chloroflexota bacterium]
MMHSWFERWNRLWGGRPARGWWLALLLASASIAVAALLYLTRDGAGVSGDAVHYMQGADNLLAGRGYSRLKAEGTTVPITAFPPFFSVVLAGLGLFLPVFDAARLLNALLLGGSVVLLGSLVFRLSGSGVYALLAGWLLMYAESIVRIHAWVMSEPLFIFLSLLALWWVNDYLFTRRWPPLLAAGLVVGAAALTRYAGLALIPAIGLIVLFSGREKGLRRLGHAALFGAASMLSVVLWFWRNAAVTGSASNRVVGYHPMSRELIDFFIDQIAVFWLPPSIGFLWPYRLVLTVVVLFAGTGIYLLAWRRARTAGASQTPAQMPVLLVVYVFFYIVLLLANTTFLDASTDEPGIRRYAIPLLPVFIVWAFTTFPLLGDLLGKKRWVGLALAVMGLGMVLYYANDSVSYLRHPNYSFGYTDMRRFWECEVTTLHQIDAATPMLTNDYELFYFLADRVAYTLPKRYDHYQAKEVADYEEKMDAIRDLLAQDAVLVVFGVPDEYGEEVKELIAGESLETWKDCGQARFLVLP